MKKTLAVLLIGFVSIFAFATELAYVDAMSVFQNVEEFKVEYDKLTTFFQEKQSQLDGKKGRIQNEIKALEDQAELMDKSKKEAKTKELQGRYDSLLKELQAAQAELNQKQSVLMQAFQQKLAIAVKLIAEKEGYDMIVLKDAVVYANVGNDVTSLVIRKMNENAPKTNKKSSKKSKKKGKK